ncbi:MAG: hypothetical protein WBQ25_11735 [Nitrososphaeraceae archaeon]
MKYVAFRDYTALEARGATLKKIVWYITLSVLQPKEKRNLES